MSTTRKFYKCGEELYINTSHRFLNSKVLEMDALNISYESLDIKNFPMIDDFEVLYVTRQRNKDSEKNYHFAFYSKSHGMLNYFPYWGIMGSKVQEFSIENIPLGTREKPFFDLEQGGVLHIIEKRNQVMVLYSFGDDYEGFHVWYTVDKDLYIEKWQKTLDWLKGNFV